ncbi:uncharacterized protein LOC18443215 isoform X2 [Amborella trichopoda]|uniref:uncharacterized protein LOC18443215 isoform X2 n=1 Tax=Amborella trichopoda TaxID=13333 RepID=UPI0009C15DF2|nr:uncharacterized protein LOC18443215 isoform X2 [Amborella trichopoda]|eukprot:XP_020528434.1 uncharacterized protein LOC18443215 isoform X2 [Amborella trichopoda]
MFYVIGAWSFLNMSCLPCGHLFGHSCIETWIQRCGKSDGKCPQCNKKCKVKDITKLYAPRIATADGDCKQQVVALQVENESLKLQAQRLSEKIDRHRIQMLEKKQLHEALMQSQRTVYEATISDLQDRITHMQLAHEELRQSKEAKLIAEIDDLSSRLMEMKKTAAMGSQASLKKLEMVEKEGRQWTSGERNVSRNKGREKTNLAEEMDYVFDPEPPQPQLPRPPISYKNLLQQEFQRLGQTLPTYVISDCGSPRRRIFKATVSHRGHDFIGALAYTRKAAEQSAAREAYVYISNHGPDPSTEERLKEANLLVEALRCQLQEKSEELASEKFISNYQEAEISRLRSELSVMGTQLEAVTAATKDLTAHLARVMALERAPEARNSSYISAGGSNHTMAE